MAREKLRRPPGLGLSSEVRGSTVVDCYQPGVRPQFSPLAKQRRKVRGGIVLSFKSGFSFASFRVIRG